jgi:poly(A) polymerase
MSAPRDALAHVVPAGWLVGGSVRDRLLERVTTDFDVALPAMSGEEVEATARRLARDAGGFVFPLSEAFGAWRVVDHDRGWQVDLMGIEGSGIEEDLWRRDLTINAIAEPLDRQGELIDPTGGIADLQAGRLRAVSPGAFEDDPLRTLRLARFGCELDFSIDPETAALARASAPRLAEVAPERCLYELCLLIGNDRALTGLKIMDGIGVTAALLPELTALHGIEQSRFHHLDVAEHTGAVLAETVALVADPEPVFGRSAVALSDYLAAPLANELTRGQALRFGALLHDIAKPQTRAETPEGRVTFMRHDETGAGEARRILERLRASERLIQYVAGLTRHHLRLGFLVHRMPLSRREIYSYLRETAPVSVDVTVLSVADRLATRGENAELAIARHLELAAQVLPEALAWTARPPRAPIRGDELSNALGIQPGPRLGELLRELEQAAFAGEVGSAEEAISYARELVKGDQ